MCKFVQNYRRDHFVLWLGVAMQIKSYFTHTEVDIAYKSNIVAEKCAELYDEHFD